MGIMASYLSLEDALADEIAQLDNSHIIGKIEELMEKQCCPVYDMDKLWDGLHCLLTGISASQPIEDHPLSEAIVGVHVLDTEEFVSVIGCEELPCILEALHSMDRTVLQQQFKPADFREKQIYPDIWLDDEAEELFAELIAELDQLIHFYEQSLAQGHDILISIY
ncbi:YfbM family protein [Lysinibacillus sp. fls2-241-R2A-57]|uniref:YfbM family protein n=1 Tax=Lysinibacillus sp. fls2-241-R2A-57 TaxID=3040292 RepID=UPI0025531DE3|nr:YfbM family protein [Lysinibacillus sp. fls2-241-R2A-57]